MKYKLTPLNLASAVLIIWIFLDYEPAGDSEGWGTLALIYFGGWAILGLIIDLVIQKLSKKYVWVLLSELLILIVLLLVLIVNN